MPEKPTDGREPIEELQPAAETAHESVEPTPEISAAPMAEASDQAAEEPAAAAVSASSPDQASPICSITACSPRSLPRM